MKEFIGYYFPQFLEDVENDTNTIYDSVKLNKKVVQVRIDWDNSGDGCIGVESKDGYYRKLYVVARRSLTDTCWTRKFFIRMSEAINWLAGTNNATEYNLTPVDISKASWSGFSNKYLDREIKNTWLIQDYAHTTDQIAKCIPAIKRIEQNIKNQTLYTTVIWEDGSKPTVVKCAEGDSPDIYFAVASAIAIKMYCSNSAFKRMIKNKTEDLNNGSK